MRVHLEIKRPGSKPVIIYTAGRGTTASFWKTLIDEYELLGWEATTVRL